MQQIEAPNFQEIAFHAYCQVEDTIDNYGLYQYLHNISSVPPVRQDGFVVTFEVEGDPDGNYTSFRITDFEGNLVAEGLATNGNIEVH